MGDRGNVVICDGEDKVYLYTHWERYRLGEIVAEALERGTERWSDAPYLARIIFCQMVQPDFAGTTGYGISSSLGDGDETFVIDVPAGSINGVPIREWLDCRVRVYGEIVGEEPVT